MIPKLAVNAYRARLLPLIALTLALAACATPFRVPVASARHPMITNGYFTLASGARLPYRDWLPVGRPRAIVLALHGFNDSRNAWAMPAPRLTAAGIAVFAPDQRGFGAAPDRGDWPGTARLVRDTRQMVAILHRRYRATRLIVMGESMGGATSLLLGAQGDPDVSAYVLIAPAVWGGKALSPALRASIALADTFVPWLRLTGQQADIRATDNMAALRALSEDPLTIHATRIASIAGLTRLMGRAQAACAHFAPPHALILYGGHDELVPKSAMAQCWRALPLSTGTRLAYYRQDYHLMLLDHQRARPTTDIIDFILHPNSPLASAATTNAMIFMAEH
ncbi:alpha/beta fold hydrolase [Acidiphilium sp.]|uniref:alpha/beta fold hydrolase n=1 Tax=Acidiphilium sp. TaxID=527 RepID=UPI003CFE1493